MSTEAAVTAYNPKSARGAFVVVLSKLGFTGPFDFYFYNNDGWYVQCKEMGHIWLGQNKSHVIERLEKQGYQFVEGYLK